MRENRLIDQSEMGDLGKFWYNKKSQMKTEPYDTTQQDVITWTTWSHEPHHHMNHTTTPSHEPRHHIITWTASSHEPHTPPYTNVRCWDMKGSVEAAGGLLIEPLTSTSSTIQYNTAHTHTHNTANTDTHTAGKCRRTMCWLNTAAARLPYKNNRTTEKLVLKSQAGVQTSSWS